MHVAPLFSVVHDDLSACFAFLSVARLQNYTGEPLKHVPTHEFVEQFEKEHNGEPLPLSGSNRVQLKQFKQAREG